MNNAKKSGMWASVLLPTIVGIGFMTPIPWQENEVSAPEAEAVAVLPERPDSFEPVLLSRHDSLQYFKLDSVLTAAFTRGRFNGHVLYAQEGHIIYNRSFGYKNFRTKDSLSREDRFQLASTSKPFAAVAVLKLRQEGKIDIELPVKHYLPDFPHDSVTVRHLLQHRSGLPNYIYVADEHWDFRKPLTNKDITPLLKRHRPRLEFKPGSRFRYCNTNYAYLASIIEAVTDTTFASVLDSYIFKPLGMAHTFVYDYKNRQQTNLVKGYSYSRRRGFYERQPDYLDGVVGDKGIFSTAEDLFLFDRALYCEAFLNEDNLTLAFTPAKPFDEKHQQDYGLGFRVKQECNGQQIAYHHGWWKGFRTYFIHDYANRRTLIWLNNRSDVTIAPYIDFIMDFASIRPAQTEVSDIQPLPAQPLSIQPLATDIKRAEPGLPDVPWRNRRESEHYGDRI